MSEAQEGHDRRGESEAGKARRAEIDTTTVRALLVMNDPHDEWGFETALEATGLDELDVQDVLEATAELVRGRFRQEGRESHGHCDEATAAAEPLPDAPPSLALPTAPQGHAGPRRDLGELAEELGRKARGRGG